MARRALFGGLLALLWAAGASGQISLQVNRTIHVDATGTSTQNCTALRNVLTGLAGSTSESEAYLVKLDPGIYNCGTNTVSVPRDVAIEGGGSRVTVITGNPNSADTGIIDFDHAALETTWGEMRFLSVHHNGGTENAVVISVDSAFIQLEHVILQNLNNGQTATGILIQAGPLFEDQAGVTLQDSSVIALLDAIKTQETGAAPSGGAAFWGFGSVIGGDVDISEGGQATCAGSHQGGSYDPLDVNCNPPPPPP